MIDPNELTNAAYEEAIGPRFWVSVTISFIAYLIILAAIIGAVY